MFNKLKSISWLYIGLMMLLAALLCFFQLAKDSLTFDEISSITIAHNWQTMWHLLWTQEGNMWLYFLILHFWLHLGKAEWIVRSLSVIFAVATVPAFYAFAKNIHSERVAKIATPLFITSIYFVFYAQMARSYALSLLLVTLSSYFFLKCIRPASSRIFLVLYVLTTSLAIYTHLLVAFAIATQYIYLLLFPKTTSWKRILLVWLGICISIFPLFLAQSVRSGHQLDWLSRPPFVWLPFGLIALSGDSIFLAVLSGIAIAVLLWKKKHIFLKSSMERFYYVWLMLWAGFPILFSYVLSVFVKPIYQPQYFNDCLPALILLVVIGLEELKKKKILYILLLTLLFFFSFLRLFQWYTESNHFVTQYVVLENDHPDDWRDAASYVIQREQSKDAVIFYAYYIREPFTYYFDMYRNTNLPKLVEISSGPYALGGGTRLPEPNLPLLETLSGKYLRIWVVLEENNTTQLGNKTQWMEIEKELQKKYLLHSSKPMDKITIQLWVRK